MQPLLIGGKPQLSYQVHRAVDERTEIITATEATAGDINEAHLLMPLIESHHATTGLTAQTVVADSKYGTIDNFLDCWDKGIYAHMPDLREIARDLFGIAPYFTKTWMFWIAQIRYSCIRIRQSPRHRARS